MKKNFLFLCLFAFNAVTLLSAKDVASSRSVYTQKPVDKEAIYFTPENFGIKADGTMDVSNALQQALNQVKNQYNYGIVFLPEGKYKISKTIYIPKAVRLIGYGAKRPMVFLAKNSPGYQSEIADDKGRANYMFWFTDAIVKEGEKPRDAGAGTFYSAISNIDLKIEDGNPYAIALRTHFAQHSFVSNVDIWIGKGKAGLFDVGNEMENVRFFGGDYGICTTKTSPSWQMMMIDISFKGQRKAAILTQEGGLTMVRMQIKDVPVAIEVENERSDKIYMEDCLLEDVRQAGILIGNEGYAPNQLSMRNVRCNHVPVLVQYRASGEQIAGKSSYYCVTDFSSGVHIKNMALMPEYGITHVEMSVLGKKTVLPPSNIPNMPPMNEWINIQDLGAKGDGITDDTNIIQQAINQYNVIYIPQGMYVVSKTLKLNEKTCIIGFNPISTQFVLNEGTSDFSGFGAPKPLLESSVGGSNIFSGIGINTGIHNYRAVGCKWMAGEKSCLNDVKFLGGHGSMQRPSTEELELQNWRNRLSKEIEIGKEKAWDTQYWSLWITNGGGGIFKNIWTANTYSTNGLYVNNTATPAFIYAMSVEHHVRNEVRFNHVSNWKIYALQLEEETRESADCQQIELQSCKNMLFANLYLFRVIRVNTPYPYAIRTWNCKEIEFYNVHNFTQMRFTTDFVCYDVNTGQDVRPWEFTRLTITGNEPRLNPLKYEVGKLEQLVTGFEYAEGLTKDSKGNVYFCEQRLRRIYKWDVETESISLIADFPWQPLSLACDTKDNLLVFFRYDPQPDYIVNGEPEKVEELPDAVGTTFSHWGNSGFATWVYSIKPDNPEETIQLLERVPMGSVEHVSKAIYPSHRWRDLHDFDMISVWKPQYCFVAPDGQTIIPEYYDFARSSSTIEAIPGNFVYAADEYNRLSVRMNVDSDGTLSNLEHFVNQGEFGITTDSDGNIYIGDGYIYVFSRDKKLQKIIQLPERPTSLIVAGKNKRTLFIAARTSLYCYEID